MNSNQNCTPLTSVTILLHQIWNKKKIQSLKYRIFYSVQKIKNWWSLGFDRLVNVFRWEHVNMAVTSYFLYLSNCYYWDILFVKVSMEIFPSLSQSGASQPCKIIMFGENTFLLNTYVDTFFYLVTSKRLVAWCGCLVPMIIQS